MNSRRLTEHEVNNRQLLNQAGLPNALIFLTETGLRKSILDATLPLRTLMEQQGYHRYSDQQQGINHKIIKSLRLLLDDRCVETKVSLYRPETKQGDPRLWPYQLGTYAESGNVLAVFIFDGILHCLNISSSRLADLSRAGCHTDTLDYLVALKKSTSSVSDELLQKLKLIARAGPIPATCVGPTAVGRALETALGISINSNQAPDYKGIEIKSGRIPITGSGTRQTLFACVPCWEISAIKSSKELLDAFGYNRAGLNCLRCTVSTKGPNSQGLELKLVPSVELLKELGPTPYRNGAVVWELPHLHERLKKKHNETMWVKAESTIQGDKEFFNLKSVTHTKQPSCAQFDELIELGDITVDHLIKEKGASAHEKGPLFKVARKSLTTLFLSKPVTHEF